jgi:very-short-patch-repair endonuclease
MPLKVADRKQYYWKLQCRLHVKLCTIEAVGKQISEHDSLGCDRCQPLWHPSQRSNFESYAWRLLEHTLEQPSVKRCMQGRMPDMTGQLMGFVVEAKVLCGKYGASDIYIPALNMIIQVDGQHHSSKYPKQLSRDARFDGEAHNQGRALLRLNHVDEPAWHTIIPNAVAMCMDQLQHGQGVIMYSPSHEQHDRPAGSVTVA